MGTAPVGPGARDAAEVVVGLSARVGFAARGVLYGIVGVLALRLAFGETGSDEEASQMGALDVVAARPFGGTLLAMLAVGLAGYALYRVVQAARGRGEGSVLSRRVVPGVRGLVNGLLSVLAWQEVLEARTERTESSVTAAALALPGGVIAVTALGLIVIGVAVGQLVHAVTGDVHELVEPRRLRGRRRTVAEVVGRLGYLGRAVVFGVVGGFLVRAALRSDPEQGVGLDAALSELIDAPSGSALLTATAVCLVLFGVHCVVEAAWSRTPSAT
jgi:hypothetical protein